MNKMNKIFHRVLSFIIVAAIVTALYSPTTFAASSSNTPSLFPSGTQTATKDPTSLSKPVDASSYPANTSEDDSPELKPNLSNLPGMQTPPSGSCNCAEPCAQEQPDTDCPVCSGNPTACQPGQMNGISLLGNGIHQDHTPDGNSGSVSWSEWNGNGSLSDGSYYLSGDATRTSGLTINGNVHLCLNGCTLDMGKNSITVEVGATLTLCDCGENGTIEGTNTRSNVKLIDVRGMAKLYSGHLWFSGGQTQDAFTVYVEDGGSLLMDGASVHLEKGNPYGYASAIYVADGGSLEFQDGVITTADSSLEGIAVGNNDASSGVDTSTNVRITGGTTPIPSLGVWKSGQVEITGGRIESVGNYGSLTMTGGTVDGNNAYLANIGGTMKLSGTAEITCQAGVTNNNSGSLTVGDGATITSTGEREFGVENSGQLVVEDGAIITAKGSMGVGINNGGSLTLSGNPTVKGTYADLAIITRDFIKDPTQAYVDVTNYTGGSLTIYDSGADKEETDGSYAIKGVESEEEFQKFQLINPAPVCAYRYDADKEAIQLFAVHIHPI